jgi:hypothetical protein
MKGKKGGGGIPHKSTMHGVDESAMDLADRPEPRTNAKKVDSEAEETRGERRHGGRSKKHVGKPHGKHGAHHAGHKPRKSGGRTGSDKAPFTSARHGTPAKGRTLESEELR